jgi:hypothetical protein
MTQCLCFIKYEDLTLIKHLSLSLSLYSGPLISLKMFSPFAYNRIAVLHSAISCISLLSNMMPSTAKGKFNFEGYKSACEE